MSSGVAIYNDIHIERNCPFADYESRWSPILNIRTLVNVTACSGSSILFAAREGVGEFKSTIMYK